MSCFYLLSWSCEVTKMMRKSVVVKLEFNVYKLGGHFFYLVKYLSSNLKLLLIKLLVTNSLPSCSIWIDQVKMLSELEPDPASQDLQGLELHRRTVGIIFWKYRNTRFYYTKNVLVSKYIVYSQNFKIKSKDGIKITEMCKNIKKCYFYARIVKKEPELFQTNQNIKKQRLGIKHGNIFFYRKLYEEQVLDASCSQDLLQMPKKYHLGRK